MASGNINDQLQAISGALALQIDKRIYPSSPWLGMVHKSTWPDEIGHTFETMKMERATPSGQNVWRTHEAPDGSGVAPCNPPKVDVTFQQSRQPISLASTALEGPPMCVENLRSKWERAEQVELATQSMGEVIRNVWIDRYRDEYVSVCDKKYVLNPNLPRTRQADGDQFALEPASSKLTNKALDFFYMDLIREGVAMYAYDMSNGQPILALVCSAETSRSLIKEDDATREDYRESSKANYLLEGLGHTHTYNGYIHIIDDTPRRATWDGGAGAWIENDAWSTDPVSGFIEQDPDYIAADHEDTIIYVKKVMECLVPNKITSIGKMQFKPQNYIGDIRWMNIPHAVDNPDETIGCYRAVLASAIRPRNTEFGVTIRHLRCVGDLELLPCS